jgi:hypothetical protein
MKLVYSNITDPGLTESQVMEILTRNLPSPNELKNHAIEKREGLLKTSGSVKQRSYLRKELFQLKKSE